MISKQLSCLPCTRTWWYRSTPYASYDRYFLYCCLLISVPQNHHSYTIKPEGIVKLSPADSC